jgi:hypothetical protein
MILKVIVFGAVLVLVALRVLRTPLGARFLGVSERALLIVYLAALVIAVGVSIWQHQWILLAVSGVLLVLEVVEQIRGARERR